LAHLDQLVNGLGKALRHLGHFRGNQVIGVQTFGLGVDHRRFAVGVIAVGVIAVVVSVVIVVMTVVIMMIVGVA
jgi:hypothetical protein